jgi:hypothetical protein
LALKDMDIGVKILGGLVAFALLLALMSNGDPDNDAWTAGDAAGASESSAVDEASDPWSAGTADDEGAPPCDAAAPFTAAGGTIRMPVHGPAVPFPTPSCQLGPGSGDAEAVGTLQQALSDCNGRPVTVDGAYGSETRAAVAAVQADHGLEVDGIYGPETRAVMAWPADDPDGEAPCISGD